MNHYATLGIDETATRQEVRLAYLRCVQEAHPDRHVGEPQFLDWHERFKQIHDAYEVLYDEERRAVYDRQRLFPRARAKVVVTPRYHRRQNAPEQWRGTPPTKAASPFRWGLTWSTAVFVLGFIALLLTQRTPARNSTGSGWGEEMVGWDEPAVRLLPTVGRDSRSSTVDSWGGDRNDDLGWGYAEDDAGAPGDEYEEEPRRTGRQYVFEDEPKLDLLPPAVSPSGMPSMSKPPRLDPFVEPAAFELGALLRFPIDPPGAPANALAYALGDRFSSPLDARISTIMKAVPPSRPTDRAKPTSTPASQDWRRGSRTPGDVGVERYPRQPRPATTSTGNEPLIYNSVFGSVPTGNLSSHWSAGGASEPLAAASLPMVTSQSSPATPTTGISTTLPPVGESAPRSWGTPRTLGSAVR